MLEILGVAKTFVNSSLDSDRAFQLNQLSLKSASERLQAPWAKETLASSSADIPPKKTKFQLSAREREADVTNASDYVLHNVNFNVSSGEFFSLLGPSGCGKTTLLRTIAGLETPSRGRIMFEGEDITNVPIQERPFHMVFQRYALFPHLSVFENLAFGPRLKKWSTTKMRTKIIELSELMGLESLLDRLPETLSGGQQQRVALARALVMEPRVLLLDEPLSALDAKLRRHMQRELKRLQRHLNMTFIFVTHDQEEAFQPSDRVAILNQGRIEQVDSPGLLQEAPKTVFVQSFLNLDFIEDDSFCIPSLAKANPQGLSLQ